MQTNRPNLFPTVTIRSIGVFVLCLVTNSANSDSIVSAELSLPIVEIKQTINSILPEPIYQLEQKRKVCVPAKWLDTKLIKTKISPEITCDISGIVSKNGDLTVRAIGEHLEVKLPISLSVTARGRGAIGKNIRETAKGSSTITVTAKPNIDNNWQIHGGVDIRYSWDTSPHIVLFNLIPITFESEVNPKVNELINELVNNELPAALSNIKLKATMSDTWNELQDPIALGNSGVFISLNPSSVAYNGINITQEKLHTQLSIGLIPVVTDTENAQQAGRSSLPPLTLDPATPDTFLVNLPVKVGYSKLNELIQSEINTSDGNSVTVLDISNIENRSERLNIRGVTLEYSDEHSTIVTIDFQYQKSDRSSLLRRLIAFFTGDMNLDGVIRVSPNFVINEHSKLTAISANLIEVDTNNDIANLIGNFVASDIFQGYLNERLSFPIESDLKKAKSQLETAINGQLGKGAKISSSLEVLEVSDEINFTNEGIELSISLSGQSSIEFDRSIF